MTKAKFVELDRGLVLITGKDGNEFLQGLISQDLNKISDSQFAYGALLTPQGKFLHCLLYTSPSPRDRTRSRMPSSA